MGKVGDYIAEQGLLEADPVKRLAALPEMLRLTVEQSGIPRDKLEELPREQQMELANRALAAVREAHPKFFTVEQQKLKVRTENNEFEGEEAERFLQRWKETAAKRRALGKEMPEPKVVQRGVSRPLRSLEVEQIAARLEKREINAGEMSDEQLAAAIRFARSMNLKSAEELHRVGRLRLRDSGVGAGGVAGKSFVESLVEGFSTASFIDTDRLLHQVENPGDDAVFASLKVPFMRKAADMQTMTELEQAVFSDQVDDFREIGALTGLLGTTLATAGVSGVTSGVGRLAVAEGVPAVMFREDAPGLAAEFAESQGVENEFVLSGLEVLENAGLARVADKFMLLARGRKIEEAEAARMLEEVSGGKLTAEEALEKLRGVKATRPADEAVEQSAAQAEAGATPEAPVGRAVDAEPELTAERLREGIEPGEMDLLARAEEIMMGPGKKTAQPMGIVPYAEKMPQAAPLWARFKKGMTEWMAPDGKLSKAQAEAKWKMRGKLMAASNQIAQTSRKLDKALRNVYGKEGATKEQLQVVNQALAGRVPTGKLPVGVAEVVSEMRLQRMQLSQRLIDEGVVQDDAALTVAENMDTYLHRSYRIYDDPKWPEKVPDEVRNEAVAFVRKELPGEDAEAVVANLLRAGEGDGVVGAMAKMGEKELSILRKRKGIPEPVRRLWGEYDDPFVNYGKTVMKMAHTLEAHRFLNTIRDDGLGRYLFERPTGNYNKRVGGGKSFSFLEQLNEAGEMETKARRVGLNDGKRKPVSELYTTPEIAQVLDDLNELGPVQSDVWRQWLKISGTVQAGKTVGSPVTHVRNFGSGFLMTAAQGHWRAQRYGEVARIIRKSLADTGGEVINRMVELNVLHDGLNRQAVETLLDDAFARESLDAMSDAVRKRGLRGAWARAADAYGAEDDFHRVFAYFNEAEDYAKALHGKRFDQLDDVARREVEEIAARNVVETMPTYSRVPKVVKTLRRAGIVGNFVSFPAEAIRTSVNTVNLAMREMRSGNAALARRGARRLASFIAVAGLGVDGLAMASRYLAGVNEDEDRAGREFMAPWDRNGAIFYLGEMENGKAPFANLSYNDPFSYWKTFVRAGLREMQNPNGRLDRAAVAAAMEVSEPFLSERILLSGLLDVTRGQTQEGMEVWGRNDPPGDKAVKSMAHLWETTQPGLTATAQRLKRGSEGYISRSGREYSLLVEGTAAVTGTRMQTMDVRTALRFRSGDLRARMNDSSGIFNAAARAYGNRATDFGMAEVVDAYRRANVRRARVMRDARNLLEAAVKTGVPAQEAVSILVENGFGKANMEALLQGRLRPVTPSKDTLEKMSENPDYAKSFARLSAVYAEFEGMPLAE